jgi:hypothetical protein
MEGISKNSGNFATLVAYMLTYKKCGFYCRAADGVDGVTDDCTAACLAPATEKKQHHLQWRDMFRIDQKENIGKRVQIIKSEYSYMEPI